ncbi:MAG: integrase arm-type DNA-binding domain-containing protein, partial [Bradymonadaceae bacterium]
MNLTKKRIEKLEFDQDGPSQQIEWDDRLNGFGIRLNPGGSKAFVVRYRNEHGRLRYYTIGRFGRMTVQQARSEALQLFAEVDGGGDPVEEERRTVADSVEELVDTYIEKHAKPRRKTWEEDERRLDKHVVERWGGRPPESLTRRDISELHREIGQSAQVEANRVVETIRTMFNFAQDEGIVEEGFNPAA